MKKCGLVLTIVSLVAAGCAHTPSPVNTTLGLQNGHDLSGKSLVYDGKQFRLDGKKVSRADVRDIQFSKPGEDAQEQASKATGTGISDEMRAQMQQGMELAAKYPGQRGVILLDEGLFRYNADGTDFYQYKFAGIVLKEEAKEWANIAMGFTEGRSRARLVYARSTNPGGVTSTLEPGAVKTGSPSEEMQFFNPNRKLISGTIPGVEIGSLVEYCYEYEEFNPEDPRLFSPGFYFQGQDPVLVSRVRVELPESVTFNHMTRNFPDGATKEPKMETANGVKSYTWEVTYSPPLIPEPNMPPESDVTPMMQGSIFKDFNEVFGLLSGLQKARMTRTPEVETVAAEITKGSKPQAEKVAKLYHWVQENTRYVSIKGSLGSGMSGHTAVETLHNRYGDCTDKAILLSTLCGAVGVEAWPIILMTNDAGSGVTEIPTLSGNHAITEVEVDGNRFFLDSTAQDYRYPYFRADDHGAIAYNAIRGEYRTIPVPPPADNRRTSRLEVALDAQGNAAVQTHNLYTGNIEAGVRGLWKQVRDDNRKAMMSEYVNRISPGAILKDFTLTDVHNLALPLEMKMSYDLPGLGIAAKDLIYFRVPTLERDYPEAALDERTYPVQYMTTEERLLDIDIRLPEGYRLKWAPDPVAGKTPGLEYRLEYRYDKKTRALKFHEEFRRLQRVIPVADYPAYRDALREIARFSQQEVFITREK